MKLKLDISDVGVTLQTAQKIWESARELLRKHGLLIKHERLKQDLAGRQGLKFIGDRVQISPDLFEAHYDSPLSKHKQLQSQGKQTALSQQNKQDSQQPISIESGGFSMAVIDWQTGQLRPATVKDLAESIKVVQAFGSTGPYCVTPQDVHPMLQDVIVYKTCFENGTDIRGSYYSSSRQAPFIEDMCQVMNEPFRLLLAAISPLSVSCEDLDNIYRTVDQGKRYLIHIVGYGMPGISSPAKLAASAALIMAENYGIALLASLVFPENKVEAGANPGGATDFRYCNYALGSAQNFAYQIIKSYISAALAGKDPSQTLAKPSAILHTGACQVDQQAATEKTAAAVRGTLMGARDFYCAGNLCVDDVFSLEQYIIDREIADYAVKMVQCCEPSAIMAEVGGLFEEIESVLAGQSFLEMPSTIEVMRAFYRPSKVFEHMKLRTWQGLGCRTVRQKAQQRIKKALAGHDFQLNADKARQLDRIYTAAQRALGG